MPVMERIEWPSKRRIAFGVVGYLADSLFRLALYFAAVFVGSYAALDTFLQVQGILS